jgi:rod shape-determining protein MreD
MNLLFYPVLSLVLVIVQTTLVPEIPFFHYCFDLLIVNVLYVSLFASHGFFVVYILVLGWIMDSLSGAPFGFYISSYLWIYVFVQILRNVIHAGNFIFIPIISAVAVVMEHGFLMFTLLVKQGGWFFSSTDMVSMCKQTLVGFFIIPLFLWLVHRCKEFWDKKVQRFSENNMGIRG